MAVSKVSRGMLLHRRVWLVLLLDAADRAGITPISKLRFHRLFYVANCLAPIYEIPQPDNKIIKYKRGPYYPDVQWDLDRIGIQGLVSISGIKYIKDRDGWWLNARYGLTDRGVAVVDHTTALPDVEKMYLFFNQLALAYSSLDDHVLDDVLLNDATYSDPSRAQGVLIDFSSWDRNFSARTAAAFQEFMGEPIAPTKREKIHLYMRYLQRVANRKTGRP